MKVKLIHVYTTVDKRGGGMRNENRTAILSKRERERERERENEIYYC